MLKMKIKLKTILNHSIKINPIINNLNCSHPTTRLIPFVIFIDEIIYFNNNNDHVEDILRF